MHPNQEVAGDPNPYYKKINLSSFECKILDKQVVYSDQSLGAVHPFLYKKEGKIIKVGTIILMALSHTPPIVHTPPIFTYFISCII